MCALCCVVDAGKSRGELRGLWYYFCAETIGRKCILLRPPRKQNKTLSGTYLYSLTDLVPMPADFLRHACTIVVKSRCPKKLSESPKIVAASSSFAPPPRSSPESFPAPLPMSGALFKYLNAGRTQCQDHRQLTSNYEELYVWHTPVLWFLA